MAIGKRQTKLLVDAAKRYDLRLTDFLVQTTEIDFHKRMNSFVGACLMRNVVWLIGHAKSS